MLFHRTLIVALLAAFVLATAAICTAQIPQKMNYQVMLTNDLDEPLADQVVSLFFTIYDEPGGGTLLWSEPPFDATTNSIGVVSVILGETSPLAPAIFATPVWMQVAVNGQTLLPRRELVSSPSALQAGNAATLASVSAEAYVLDDDLSDVGAINTPDNPVDWTKLKNVPACFADGVDHTGSDADGHSLDADDGYPTDVVYVHGDGIVTVGDPVAVYGSPKLQVFGTPDETAAYFKASTGTIFEVGIFARSDSSSAIIGNSKTTADYYAASPAAVVGVADMDAQAGAFFANGDGDGVYATSWGAGDALYACAWGGGRSGYFGRGGVEVELPDANLWPALQVTNLEASWYGDCLHLDSQPGCRTDSHTLDSHCYNGQAGYFAKETNDYTYAVMVASPDYDKPGLYVFGYIYATSLMAREVETSRGKEAVFSLSSPEVEMVSSGKGRLSAGAARIDFDRTFAESITGPDDLRITATPVGGWSALYVENIDADGFELRSESGRTDVEFHWTAVGRAEGHERSPEIIIPDHEEEERLLKLKEAEMKSHRPPRDRPERPGVVAAENQ
jgi:hypothetical protein